MIELCYKRAVISQLDFIILIRQTVDAIITSPVKAIFKAV